MASVLYFYGFELILIINLFLNIDGETHEEKLEWLTKHHEPWDEVRSLWKDTIDVRHFQLRNNEITIEQLFTTYRPLAGARGYELVSVFLKKHV